MLHVAGRLDDQLPGGRLQDAPEAKAAFRKKSDKIVDLARRGGADLTSASRCDLDYGTASAEGESGSI